MTKQGLLYLTLWVTLAQIIIVPWGGFSIFNWLEKKYTRLEKKIDQAYQNQRVTFFDEKGLPFDQHDLTQNFYDVVKLTEVDPALVADLLAIEDKNFYSHNGVDYLATLRATFFFFFSYPASWFDKKWAASLRSGGSTITQQTIKVIMGHQRRSIKNKFIEIMLADMLEDRLAEKLGSKDKTKKAILTLYINYIPVANRTYGLKLAAHLLFNKGDIKSLDIIERITMLASIQAPSKVIGNRRGFLPLVKKISGRLKKRKRIAQGYQVDLPDLSGFYPRYLKLLERDFKIARTPYARTFLATGLAVKHANYTFRNSPLEEKMMPVFKRYLRKHNQAFEKECTVTGAALLVALQTAEIKTVLEDDCDEFNEVVRGRRQVMSTIKPFLYAQAMKELNLSPASTFTDERKTYIDQMGMKYAPGNHYKIFKGPLTLKSALQFSSNTVSLQLLKKLGVAEFSQALQNIYQVHPGEDLAPRIYEDISLALGTAEFSPAHVAAAYTSLLNDGIKKYPAFSKDTRYSQGDQVLQPDRANQVREMMSAVVRRTGSRGSYFSYHPDLVYSYLGGKSGTGPADSWFVGFSQDLLLVLWLGTRTRTDRQLRFSAKELWPHLFVLTQRFYPARPLKHPAHLKKQFFCKFSGKRPGKNCSRIENGLFLKELPAEKCDKHGKYDKR